MKNKFLSICFIMQLVIPVTGFTEEPHGSSELKIAAQWVTGTVVKPPYRTDYLRMRVDRVTYIVLPQCTMVKRERAKSGAYQEQTISASAIKKGNKVDLLAHANRLFQIIVFE